MESSNRLNCRLDYNCILYLCLCAGRARESVRVGSSAGSDVYKGQAVVVLVDMSDVVQDHDVRAACVCGGASVARERVRVLSALIRACVACVRPRGLWAVGREWGWGRMAGCGVAVGCGGYRQRWMGGGCGVVWCGVGVCGCGGVCVCVCMCGQARVCVCVKECVLVCVSGGEGRRGGV